MIFICALLVSSATTAQDYSMLDPEPYRPGIDSDIDMFMNNWRNSIPRHTHGSLVERDVFTKGDPLHPPRKGAVLTYMDSYSYSTLDAGASTTPLTLNGKQEVFYFFPEPVS